jgi:hypothetical protein
MQLKQREEQFEKKRKEIERQKRERELQDLKDAGVNLKMVEERISEGANKHHSQIQRVISEARFRNTMQSEKVNRWKEEKEKQEQVEMLVLF